MVPAIRYLSELHEKKNAQRRFSTLSSTGKFNAFLMYSTKDSFHVIASSIPYKIYFQNVSPVAF